MRIQIWFPMIQKMLENDISPWLTSNQIVKFGYFRKIQESPKLVLRHQKSVLDI